MGSTIYPNIDQATLDGMSLHDTLIYPANDGGGIAYHGRITKVPNGWLYGHEFVPDTLCCTGADSFFYYDQTGSNAPVAPTTPTTTPPVIADGALLVELWDDVSRYWKYDAGTSSWSYDDIASGGLASVSTDATITGNGTPGSPLSVDKTGDWTGTFDGQDGSYYLDYDNLSNKPTIPTASDLPFDIAWNGNADVPTKNAVYDKLVSLTAADITDFDAEVSNNVDVAANTAARHAAVTVTDSSEIDFTLVGQDITASIKAGSIDETKLDVSTNASLDLADSSVQPGDNISTLTNDAGYITGVIASDVPVTPFDAVTSTNVQDALEEIYGDLVIESGFANRTDSTLSFDDGTRTFTIAPAVTSFTFWVQNQKYTISSPDTYVIPNVEGIHYIYYDQTGTLTSTQIFTPAIITDFTFVCYVYWDATNLKHIFFGDERHGRTMDSSTHSYLHNILSTQYDSGLQPGNIIADGSGALDSHIQCSISDGVIRDEDIRIAIENGSPQTLGPILNVPFYYRSGAAGDWRQVTAANYLATTTGTGRAAWNEFTGATWQLTEVSNNSFVLTHLIATNDITHPVIAIAGQNEYISVADARAGALSEISTLAYGPLEDALPEYKPICTFIVQTSNAYSNAVKSRIRTTDEGDDFIDWRSSDFNPIGGSGSSDHGNLTGLGDDDHLQYHNDTRGDARYYTQALLDGGQLDTRYYTETETDTLLLGKSNVGHTHSASDITDFDTEVSNNVDVAANTAARHDAVTVLDSSEIDFTLAGQQITASIINGSIVFSKLQNISTNHLIGRHTAGSGSPEQIQIDGGLNLSGATLRRSALTGAITASEGSNSTSLGSFTKAQLDTAISDGNAVYSGDNVSVLTNDANYAAYTPDGGIALTGQFEQEIVDHGSKAAGFSVDCNAGNIHELIVTASISVTLTNLVPGVVHTFVVFSNGGSYNLSFAPSSGSSYRDYSTTMNTNAFYVYRIVAVSSTNIFVSRTGPYA